MLFFSGIPGDIVDFGRVSGAAINFERICKSQVALKWLFLKNDAEVDSCNPFYVVTYWLGSGTPISLKDDAEIDCYYPFRLLPHRSEAAPQSHDL